MTRTRFRPGWCILAFLIVCLDRGRAEPTSYEELFMGLKSPLSEKPHPLVPKDKPEETVRVLYSDSVFFNLRNSFPKDATAGVETCFTPSLVQHFEKCREDIRRWMTAPREGMQKLPMNEGTIFLSCYDGGTSFEIGKPKIKGDTAKVPVMLTYRENSSVYKWTDTPVLKLVNGVWLLDDIKFGGAFTLRKRVSLRLTP